MRIYMASTGPGNHGMPAITFAAVRHELEMGSMPPARSCRVLADLSSQAQIHELSEEIHHQLSRIDVVLNNAGAIFAHRDSPATRSKRRSPRSLAPFLLTHLLFDLFPRLRPAALSTLPRNPIAGSWISTIFKSEGAMTPSRPITVPSSAIFSLHMSWRAACRETITSNCVSPDLRSRASATT